MKIRSFLAFDVPKNVCSNLSTLISDLNQYEEKVKWSDPSRFHVTIKYLGDIEEELLLTDISDEINEKCKKFFPVIIECAGVGVFPNWKYPRVIWAGFSGVTDTIISMHEDLNDALQKFPIKSDVRTFRLHLTIGRVKAIGKKSALVKRVESLGPVSFGDVPVNKLVLYGSKLTKEGAIYTPLKTFNLGTTKE